MELIHLQIPKMMRLSPNMEASLTRHQNHLIGEEACPAKKPQQHSIVQRIQIQHLELHWLLSFLHIDLQMEFSDIILQFCSRDAFSVANPFRFTCAWDQLIAFQNYLTTVAPSVSITYFQGSRAKI